MLEMLASIRLGWMVRREAREANGLPRILLSLLCFGEVLLRVEAKAE